jgi:hypothetical protein
MKRRLPLIFVAAVTVIGVVVAVVAIVVAGVGGSAVAYTVNGTKVSQKTIDDQLDELAASKAAKQSARQQGKAVSDSSVSPQITASVLTQRIALDLLRDTAQRRKVAVSAADRAAALRSARQQLPGLPASYVRLQADLGAHQRALGLDQTGFSALLGRAFRRADVTVDPRYGRWNPRQGVCPTTGCASSAAGG